MAVLGQPGEDVRALLASAPQSPQSTPAAAPTVAPPAPPTAPPAPARAPGERVKISPVAKKLAQEHGVPCKEGTLIDLSLTQQNIASMVGASRVMVSQVIQGLIQGGYMTRSKKSYIVKTGCPFDCI
jgi:pyruvate/2-oxoglutarate dehydrogenase complex dihydrolipoamide acyltransferase (E2) component